MTELDTPQDKIVSAFQLKNVNRKVCREQTSFKEWNEARNLRKNACIGGAFGGPDHANLYNTMIVGTTGKPRNKGKKS